MANTLNPDLIGLTEQEKRKVNARKWQNENREEYRSYQAAYQRKYQKDPRKVIIRLQRRIDEILGITSRIEQRYELLLAPYRIELAQLQLAVQEQANLISTGQLNYKSREAQNGN